MRLNEIKENREEGKVSPGALQRLEKEGTSKGDQGSSQRGRGKAQEDAVWEPQCPKERQPPAVPDTGEAG